MDAPGDADELVVSRFIAAPRSAVYRAWTDPAVIVRWFTPPPWTTVSAELDVRAGGGNLIVMRGPDGTEMPNRGIYLEVVPDARLVTTDAYTAGWEPTAKPFMTLIVTFDDEAGPDGAVGTRYIARVRHWRADDRAAHLAMGFEAGWGIATDQLAAVAASL